jgi:hypothetical protein
VYRRRFDLDPLGECQLDAWVAASCALVLAPCSICTTDADEGFYISEASLPAGALVLRVEFTITLRALAMPGRAFLTTEPRLLASVLRHEIRAKLVYELSQFFIVPLFIAA